MIILTIRTDNPEAEIGLYENDRQLAYKTWTAHRELAETLLRQIDEMIKGQGINLPELDGIVCYKGPGSFTGLRIGLSVANALSYSMKIPIVGTSDDWLVSGISKIMNKQNDALAIPEYGSPVYTTQPKK
jgi:tRNA threonylcarbamoyladenosine biosynthesis protein TsaB